MKQDVIIELTSIIESDGEQQKIEITTRGKLLVGENAVFLSYKETEQSGYDGCTVLIRAEGSEKVCVSRSVDALSQLVVENGKRHICSYATPHGSLNLGVTCCSIKNELDDRGYGKLSFSYELDVNMGLIGKNQLFIKIEECKN